LPEAIDLFELRPEDYVSDLETTPRFGVADRDLWFAGYKHIVVEVDRGEARQADFRPGFYRSRVKPNTAFGKLIHRALVTELGEKNVVRVVWEPATDSQDRDAIRITVVIAPGALKKIKDGAVLDALVRLKEQLRAMKDDRTPIIEYATEAELSQDAGP
jgi:hypothetical protein